MLRPIALALLVASTMLAADPADSVREAASGWTQAAVKQDQASLNRWLADDLTYSHANGKTQNKAEYIAAVTKGPPRYESFTFSGTEVRFYGKTAVLTGFVDVKMAKTDSFRVRTLQVYVENNGRWQMAAHQSARVSH
jgi:ketosteroid isomerase-like protein